MTDRLKGCLVVFDYDIREDDAAGIMDAIARLRGVRSVGPSLADADDWMNRERVRRELSDLLFAVLAEPKK